MCREVSIIIVPFRHLIALGDGPRSSEPRSGQIVEYRDCGLSYCIIAARVGRDPMTFSRMWNRWVQDGTTKGRAESQRPPVTSS
ncbi:hypothetical protein TNCV_2348071 [Trichonephila clavipes]|uniref:Uncharacterized protein n=1 Tax=Trichonephila clavipes TaxID=2585209 RepID=A0A8X6VF30_TRICX|nr:hypothetical protein TNCV_2348071 [Trichonephila clavipes]